MSIKLTEETIQEAIRCLDAGSKILIVIDRNGYEYVICPCGNGFISDYLSNNIYLDSEMVIRTTLNVLLEEHSEDEFHLKMDLFSKMSNEELVEELFLNSQSLESIDDFNDYDFKMDRILALKEEILVRMV